MLYRVWWFLLVPLIRAYWRVRVRGRHHVPRRGGAILASNHQSGLDPILVCSAFWRHVYWLAKIEYVITPKVAWFFRSVSVIPVNRDAPREESLAAAADSVRRGRLFGIYPEGTRSLDGRLYRGYTGVARIAAMSGAPVIPTGVVGSREALPKGKILARPRRCEVRFGPPLRFAMRPGEDEHDAHRRFTDEVMDAIAALTGQERADVYSREPQRKAS
jgi:1-acyl-sn-glycerol-3-phosphate acyltransferase